jgi:hypothetical protein
MTSDIKKSKWCAGSFPSDDKHVLQASDSAPKPNSSLRRVKLALLAYVLTNFVLESASTKLKTAEDETEE